jgi:para-nitrobenzyl esterase
VILLHRKDQTPPNNGLESSRQLVHAIIVSKARDSSRTLGRSLIPFMTCQRAFGMSVSVVAILGMIAVAARTQTSGEQKDPIAATKDGLIRGSLLKSGGAVFKGIPYAQPPVAALRWREPMPLKSWTEIRDATRFGAACMQGVRPGPNVVTGALSEDCLFLNVWTPEWPSRAGKPVMVEINGGGHYSGAGSLDLYNGESLSRQGVVLVSINYRLGVFGLFAHSELSRESPQHASGNQSLLDQVAALHYGIR